jgi:DNA-binding CsgD family transcriptional regulator
VSEGSVTDALRLRARLTPREYEAVIHAYNGKSNDEIAVAMGLSRKRVDHLLEAVYDRLGVGLRLDAFHLLGLTPGRLEPVAPRRRRRESDQLTLEIA